MSVDMILDQVDALNAEGKFDEADALLTERRLQLDAQLGALLELRLIQDKLRPGRTDQKFANVWKSLIWWMGFHKKPVWLVPEVNGYALSVIAPTEAALPYGTRAIKYGPNPDDPDNPEELEFVTSNRSN